MVEEKNLKNTYVESNIIHPRNLNIEDVIICIPPYIVSYL